MSDDPKESIPSPDPTRIPVVDVMAIFFQGGGQDGSLWSQLNDDPMLLTVSRTRQIENVTISESPSAVWFGDRTWLFFQGAGRDGHLYAMKAKQQNWSWEDPVRLPNTRLSASPSAVVFGDMLYVFHQGENDNGTLWVNRSPDGVEWLGDRLIEAVGVTGSPNAVVWNDKLNVFHQGIGGNGELWVTVSSDGEHWEPDVRLPSALTDSPGALAGMSLRVYHQLANHSGLLGYCETEDGVHWSPMIPVSAVRMSASPTAFVDHRGLNIWFQGSGDSGEVWRYTDLFGDTSVRRMEGFMSGSPSAAKYRHYNNRQGLPPS